MTIEKGLAVLKEMGEIEWDGIDTPSDRKYRSLSDSLDEVNWDDMSQDQLVKFLDGTRNTSWDIPSALMTICEHGSDDSDEVPFFMHRPAWRIVEDEEGERKVEDEVDNSFWEATDNHFLEVHGWNLKDERINWSFDT